MKTFPIRSLKTAIVVGIALFTLVVLVILFTGNMTRFWKAYERCDAKKGECVPKGTCTEESGTEIKAYCPDSRGFPDRTKSCCIKAPGAAFAESI